MFIRRFAVVNVRAAQVRDIMIFDILDVSFLLTCRR